MADVLVVGGGIGGLSLARELSLRGLRATVLEKAPQLNPVGAGIRLLAEKLPHSAGGPQRREDARRARAPARVP